MNRELINTIWSQIGGNRFGYMVGARNHVAMENGLAFQFGRNASKSNTLRITLGGNDLYRMEFGHIRKFDYTVDRVFEDVYFDNLAHLFSQYTGMTVSLGVLS